MPLASIQSFAVMALYISAASLSGKVDLITEICPDCRRKVKPQTIAEFVEEAHDNKIKLRSPKIQGFPAD